MADYDSSEAMGYGGESFLEAFRNNQNASNDEAIYSHPVAATVVSLMQNIAKWSGSVARFIKRT